MLNNVILETSSIVWQRLQGKKLKIGYQIVDAVDQTPLIQCYNSLVFGRKARDCDNDTKCGHCAGLMILGIYRHAAQTAQS